MSEPDEAMVEAVAMAIRDERGALDVDADGIPDPQWRTLARAALSVPVVRDALARDGRAGCHAITDDDGTTYCPLAEANMRAVARDAQVREIVAKARAEVEAIPGGDSAAWAAADAGFSIAALYDRDDSEEQR